MENAASPEPPVATVEFAGKDIFVAWSVKDILVDGLYVKDLFVAWSVKDILVDGIDVKDLFVALSGYQGWKSREV